MKKILTQVGTLNSLMMGDYYATETVDELLKNGDIGIGTYEGLDGEAIILNGVPMILVLMVKPMLWIKMINYHSQL